jgi:hypothetical protein
MAEQVKSEKYLYTLNFESPAGKRGTHTFLVTSGAPELVQHMDDFLSKAPGYIVLSLNLHDIPVYDASLEEVLAAEHS